ncbi:MAG: electron transfer flavoprotein subunit beta/FixA family protein [Flavobacteriaceae bacterium]|jgi:electron transfer flavoprotein beta subunit|nr:electron transfer flavoprotein subunit beta/FixA family protein [Flavobacteriaceae bacterium]
MKKFNIVVLAKQVPDTRKAGKDAMKADGTINRSILPAIFNPEDLHALEQALNVKDQYPGSTITLLTMGPPRAVEILKEGFYRGADDGILLTDRAFAGSDTLATSYALASAIKSIGEVDIIFSGRQAIDGDTAQVGPQVAEKLGIPQVTYAEEIVKITDKAIQVKRRLEHGVETVECPFPLVITVNNTAPHCRPRNAKRLMKYKHASTMSNRQENNDDYLASAIAHPHLTIKEWGVNNITVDHEQLGLTGSPTKVKKVDNIIFQAVETKTFTDLDEDIDELMKELVESHIVG